MVNVSVPVISYTLYDATQVVGKNNNIANALLDKVLRIP